MAARDAESRSGRSRALGMAGLVVALGIAAAVRWTLPAAVADLYPRPDALEYEEGARNLALGNGYCLLIDGKKYAPHYPFGFSALLAPVLLVAGDSPGTGIWLVFASALVAIAATWALARATGGEASATAAAVLLALSPLHVDWSRAVMSDVPSSALVAGVALGALTAWRRRASPVTWAALGVAGALAATVRQTAALILLPAAALAAHAGGGLAMAALGAGSAVGLVPLFAYQMIRFGSPFRDGYAAWVPMPLFDLRYAFGPTNFGSSGGNVAFYALQLAGGGTAYPWPIAVLVLAGAVLALRRSGRVGPAGPARALACLGLGFVTALIGVQALLFWQGDRFLVPALPLLLALAGQPFATDEPRPVRVGALLLATLGVGMIAARPAPFTSVARDYQEAESLRAIDAAVEPDAIVLAHGDPFLVRRILRQRGDRRWLPIGTFEHAQLIRLSGIRPYADAPEDLGWMLPPLVAPFVPAAVEMRLHEVLFSGRPVYMTHDYEVPFMTPLLRLLRSRFRLAPAAPSSPSSVFRVTER